MGDSGDFIFARRPDGILEFKGDFEGLYQSDPDPWGQSGGDPRMKEYYAFSRRRLLLTLNDLPWKTLLEAGCGTGHVAFQIDRSFHPQRKVFGCDVSESAIKQARQLFPWLKFNVQDIGDTEDPQMSAWFEAQCDRVRRPRHHPDPPVGRSLRSRRSVTDWGLYDVIVLSQTLWYVLNRLPAVFENALALLAPHGHFIIQMAFLDKQEYGREIVDGFNGLLRYVLDRYGADFQVVSASYDASSRFAPYHDGLLVLQSTR